MRIQHNIMAMGAYRNYTNNLSAMKKNLEKLSSGYKINRAGDDAAGLAISEKMRAQITGLETAQKNAKDGISLVQTAEGALTEVHDMLNRMVTLATQSANGTYDNETDREQLQKELDQLRSEINRIADSSNFNGIKLLDGSREASSANPMASVDIISSLDGTNPSAGAKAKVEFTLPTASSTPTLDALTATGKLNGQPNTPAGSAATITLTMGGLKADATGFSIAGTIGGNTCAATKNLTGKATDIGNWKAGDTITITDADGGTHTYAYDATTMANWNAVKAAAKADGITLDETQAVSATATTSVMKGLSANITAGTTDVDTLKGLTVGGKKLSDLYEVKVFEADGTTEHTTGTDTIENGYQIKLTAKYGGQLTAGDKAAFTAITEDSSSGIAGNAASKATAINEANNEGTPATTPDTAGYELTFNFANISAGQSFSIGDKNFIIENKDTATVDSGNNYYINLHDITDADGADDIWNDVAGAIQGKLNSAFGSNFTVNAATNDASDVSGKTWKIEMDAIQGKAAADVNLGAVRLDANTAHSGLLTSQYTARTEQAPGSLTDPSGDAFARVSYDVKATDLKADTELEIDGKKLIIKSSSYTGATGVDDPANPSTYTLKLGASDTNASAAQIVSAFEQLGFNQGQISFNGDGKLTIKGTSVGETGADLETSYNGKVKFKAAPASPSTVTFQDKNKSTANANVITIGTTSIDDLKNMTIKADDADGNEKTYKLGDIFNISVEGSSSTSSPIASNKKVTFEAKNIGKLDEKLLDALKLDGNVKVDIKNGWDEGTSASGNNTVYGLNIDLSKTAGGNTFTFGNADNDRSITFELSYDEVTTDNGTVDNSKYDDLAGNTKVTINLFNKNAADSKTAIENAITTAMGNDFDVAVNLDGNTVKISMVAKEEGSEYNWGNVRVSANDTSATSTTNPFSNLVYTPADKAADVTPGTYAQVSYDFDASKLRSGDSLTIGDTTVYFGDSKKTENVSGKTKITLDVAEASKDPDQIAKAFESSGYKSGQIQFKDGKLTITDNEIGRTAADFVNANAKVSLTASRKEGELVGGLMLQIGDTADSFNQLRVSIKDMHTDAMGASDKDATTIADISIADQDNAAKAVDVIKRAINYVSDVRGTLGATQNRLDHTINNLSVMTENIQDAESTIRDTDVAEEMMAYTKNNILIQSAQAMLAQANQVPQGVLQLLG